jgi:hypothetical protein
MTVAYSYPQRLRGKQAATVKFGAVANFEHCERCSEVEIGQPLNCELPATHKRRLR